MITMTRRVTFAAEHMMGNECRSYDLDPVDHAGAFEERVRGHDYVLDVSVSGEIDATTGIVINIKDIDRIIRERIVQLFDGKLIYRQLGNARCTPTTLENLVGFTIGRLKDFLPAVVRLDRVRLATGALTRVEWRSDEIRCREESRLMLLTRGYEFSASHRLHSPHLSAEANRELFGKCNYEHGHGHNYELEVTVSGPLDPKSGRVLDPALLDEIVNREVVDRYDHRHFNYDIPEFAGLVPSAEVITRIIWDRLRDLIPTPAHLHRILLRETARSSFEYYGEV
jgi:6-pyruvoyltetrahydropterin/6-carboxytetrahydropterin synthase